MTLLSRLRRPFRGGAPYVPVLRLQGVIMAQPGGRALSLQGLARPIERAFADRSAAAVALVVNSPGGSAAQSALIADRIRAHAAETGIPVVAFVEDVAASGGYWIACAADEIYALETSVVGSIGVLAAGFGFDRLIARWAIDRRVYTAGEKKVILDPFQPERKEDVAILRTLQQDVHDSFKAWVRRRRAGRLKGTEDQLFSGEFWTGGRAVPLGLIDGIGDVRATLRARFGDRTRFRLVNPPRTSPLALLSGGAARAALDLAEERALLARFGL